MPICRMSRKIIYFVHVPKCAGTAVENYLSARFGPLGMLDPAFARRSKREAWTLSPPQHMPEPVRAELFPNHLFDAIFATVRHPAQRMRSVFLFQREIEQAVPQAMEFEVWLKTVRRILVTDPYALHGHLRPMSEMVPHCATVFRIEDGLDPVVEWLDALDDSSSDGRPATIGPANVLAARMKRSGRDVPEIALTPEALALIADIYAADYVRFGYPEDPDQANVPA